MSDLDPTTGMTLRATTSGWRYRITGVSDSRVVATGPHGSLGVPRDELERDIRAGRVEIGRWP